MNKRYAIFNMDGALSLPGAGQTPPRPEAQAYLRQLKARGVTLCAVTTAARPLAQQRLSLLGLEDCFSRLFSCESYGVSKEQADIYWIAADYMGAFPDEIAVFENSLHGVKTAKSAGFYTVGMREQSDSPGWEALAALADETIAFS